MTIAKNLLTGLLAGASISASAQAMPASEAAKLFGARSTAWHADLSPSGRKVIFMSAGPGGRTIAKLLDRDTGAISNVLASDGRPESLEWCEFASETQLVCRFGGTVANEGKVIGFSRLVTSTTAGSNVRALGRKQSMLETYVRQFDGAVLDWLPDGDGSILMAREYVPEVQDSNWRVTNSKAEGLGVDRIDLATLKATAVEPPKAKVSHYMTDGHGAVRLVAFEDSNDDMLTGAIRFRYRTPGSRDWLDLGRYNQSDGSGMWPLAVEQAINSVYFLEKLGGRDALYRMPLDGSHLKTLVAKNEKVDIAGIVRLDRGRSVIGYTYTDDRSRVEYFDPEHKKLALALGRALPATPVIQFISSSRDGKTLLVHASADTDAGAYYVLDRASMRMEPVLNSRQQLVGQQLAPVQAISYAAADGTMIPAYLTVTQDGPARGRPAVILPHGGPSARDEWGFDWLAQFLAARGYAVIQPNYRGSAGYGDDFLGENAFRDWRTAMADIGAAGRYLVSQGIADPKRLAIVGWSYGGYAALQSATLEPETYKAVVAIAPVTDLSALKSEAEGFTNARLTEKFVGEGEHIRTGSPLQNAARIKAPVLLVHGDLDGNVRVAHSIKMAAALKKGGTPVELIRYKDLEHQLDDSTARTEMLTKIAALLDRTIGQ